MYNTRQISEGIHWIGGSDRRLNLFENLFPLPNGVTYNSYVILDEKVAVLDTVDPSVSEVFFENIDQLLAGRPVDYLVVHHMEPDHSAEIGKLCRAWPDMKIVGSAKIFELIGQFFDADLSDRFHEVKEGDELALGKHTLRFVAAPMVHWPEVIFSFDTASGALFAADAFGSFGAFSAGIFADEVGFEENFMEEARRYYANIVGKYGNQVQMALKKAAGLDVKMICPLHGPIWRENLALILDKYNKWSSYQPEEQGVVLAYGSMYGHTAALASVIGEMLAEAGVTGVKAFDVSKAHVSDIISAIFRYSHLVLAAPTYNMGIYLPMAQLLHDMKALNVQKRTVLVAGNGSWSPVCPKLVCDELDAMKEMTRVGDPFVIKSALKKDQLDELRQLVAQFAKTLQ